MIRINYLVLVLTLFCISCKKDKAEIDENRVVFEKLDGDYRIFAASSDQPYDINMDGFKDADLMNELPNLSSSFITIVVSKQMKTFRLSWVEQFVNADPLPARYYYIDQGGINTFDVDQKIEHVFIKKGAPENSKFSLPYSVDVSVKDRVRIGLVRNIITSAGEKTIHIDAIYKKIRSDRTYK